MLPPDETRRGPCDGLQQSGCVPFSCVMCVQALCAAVVAPDVQQTMVLVFSGANVMCATGDPAVSTPYLLAQRAGQRLQMEFLYQNKLTGKISELGSTCNLLLVMRLGPSLQPQSS